MLVEELLKWLDLANEIPSYLSNLVSHVDVLQPYMAIVSSRLGNYRCTFVIRY